MISATSLKEMSKIGGFLPLLATLIPLIAGGLSAGAAAMSIAKNVKDMVQGKGFISDLGIPIISPLAAKIGLGRKKRGKGGAFIGPPVLKCGRKISRGEGGVTVGPPRR